MNDDPLVRAVRDSITRMLSEDRKWLDGAVRKHLRAEIEANIDREIDRLLNSAEWQESFQSTVDAAFKQQHWSKFVAAQIEELIAVNLPNRIRMHVFDLVCASREYDELVNNAASTGIKKLRQIRISVTPTGSPE